MSPFLQKRTLAGRIARVSTSILFVVLVLLTLLLHYSSLVISKDFQSEYQKQFQLFVNESVLPGVVFVEHLHPVLMGTINSKMMSGARVVSTKNGVSNVLFSNLDNVKKKKDLSFRFRESMGGSEWIDIIIYKEQGMINSVITSLRYLAVGLFFILFFVLFFINKTLKMHVLNPIHDLLTELKDQNDVKDYYPVSGFKTYDSEFDDFALAIVENGNLKKEAIKQDKDKEDVIKRVTAENDDLIAAIRHDQGHPANIAMNSLKDCAIALNDCSSNDCKGLLKYIHRAEASINNLRFLVQNTTKSKNVSGAKDSTLQDRSVDIYQKSIDCIKIFLFDSQDKGIHYYFELTDIKHVLLDVNIEVFVSSLSNILSNAFKYYDPKKISSMVSVTVSIFEQKLIVTVEDNGIGIAKREIEKVTQKDKRASNVKKIPGQGRGMFNVETNLSENGGALHIESTQGSGSKFVFELPVRNVLLKEKVDKKVSYYSIIGKNYKEGSLVEKTLLSLPIEMSESCKGIKGVGCIDGMDPGSDLYILYSSTSTQEDKVLLSNLSRASVASGHTVKILTEFDSERTVQISQAALNSMGVSELMSIEDVLYGLTYQSTGVDGGVEPEKLKAFAQQKNVLIIDDSLIYIKDVARGLKRLGCKEVFEVSSGINELLCKDTRFLDGHRIDVVITDCMMQEINGYDLALVLRELGYKGVIVGFSAGALSEAQEECFDIFLQKEIATIDENLMSSVYLLERERLNASV